MGVLENGRVLICLQKMDVKRAELLKPKRKSPPTHLHCFFQGCADN